MNIKKHENKMKKIKFNKALFLILVWVLNIILFSYSSAFALCKEDKSKKSKEQSKVVFLTFDDGPSVNNTKKIIHVLKENNVRATFFVIGALGEENKEVFLELSKNNMCIASHTYSHDYNEIYKSVENYMNDLKKCNNLISNVSKRKPVPYIRMPGGANNRVCNKNTLNNIKNKLKEQGINYIGWNICGNDALGKNVPAYKIKNNIMKQTESIEKYNNVLVVLLHDSYYKKTTVEALPEIIKYYKEKGYTIKAFDEMTPYEYKELVKKKIIN